MAGSVARNGKRKLTPRDTPEATAPRRLPKAERHQQLLDSALTIIREEGADRLTLGYLATRAGVSKPIAYEHFGTRSGLLIALYRSLDNQQVQALREKLAVGEWSLPATAAALATAYIQCAADASGNWQAVGAALAGSAERETVQQELLDGYVQLFASLLGPYSTLATAELTRCCVGLVGAGEALAAAIMHGHCSEADAAATFTTLIEGSLRVPAP